MSPDTVKLVQTADEEASRVLTIARSSLDFLRQSSEPERTDLLSAAESVRVVLQSLLERQKITLRIQASGDVAIEALAGETRQVLLNLVRNACEASGHSGSEVLVSLAGRSECVEIVVQDQGAGIPPAQLPNLFQFGKTTKGEQGNGMGLWTVKHILDRHHASIDVTSRLGEGTTFVVRWPIHFERGEASTGLVASRA